MTITAKQKGETMGIVSVAIDGDTAKTAVVSKETMAEMYSRDRRAYLLGKLADAQEQEIDRLWGLCTPAEL